jgi:hypothetical protein
LEIIHHLRREKPNLAVFDSDYHFIPFLLRRIPVFSLGQGWDVERRARQASILKHGFWQFASSFLFEKLDSLVARALSDRVLVPVFEPSATPKRVETIPLIVRKEFLREDRREPTELACVLLSGSGLEAEELIRFAHQERLPVLGPTQGQWQALIDPDGFPVIDRFRVVICQGGLSSISECIARKRPMIVVPMQGHAEQWLNAREVEKLGLGIPLSASALSREKLTETLHRVLPETYKYLSCNGARQASRLILDRLGFLG